MKEKATEQLDQAVKETERFDQAMVDYAQVLYKHGVLEGPCGKRKFDGDVQQLLDAIHTVLAGGKLEAVRVADQKIDQGVFQKLKHASEKPVRIFNREEPKLGDDFYG